ncbi:hypothetical protein [Tsukamurella sp. PLM1]|uniref:hypothetical protein n=1 Tax=Tsukamurella sp. PLM1 TaxID=2929795 RepID=UPI0020638DD7|nr:hypothetical protein [Tsukamurella sp. PLM1]BDH55367.1 hypothetical protein MTP03_03060 [Tsukamurella sp. PLM1]
MRSRDVALAAWSAVLGVVILGPLAVGGRYLVLRDAVSTPRSHLTDAALGLGGNAARATPQDWLLAVGSQVVDGGLLVTALLFVSLVAAGWGFGRCALAVLAAVGRPAGTGAGLAAASVGLWNPFVAERLLQGHWSLLAGYAAIGWVVVVGLESSGWRQVGGFAVGLAAGGLTPTGAVFALVAGLVAVPRRWAWQVGLFVLAAAPWVYPSLVSGTGIRTDPASVAAFSARAEPGLGTLGSLLGLGGIWNRQAVPDGAPWLWTALVLAVLASGLLVLRGRLLALPGPARAARPVRGGAAGAGGHRSGRRAARGRGPGYPRQRAAARRPEVGGAGGPARRDLRGRPGRGDARARAGGGSGDRGGGTDRGAPGVGVGRRRGVGAGDLPGVVAHRRRCRAAGCGRGRRAAARDVPAVRLRPARADPGPGAAHAARARPADR